MNALTPAERQRLIAAGLMSFPPAAPKRTTRTPVRKSKPKPAPFQGTPQERAKHAVALARTGRYALTEVAKACGYFPSSSSAIRQLVAGCGPLIDLAREGEEKGRLSHTIGINRAALRIVRDFYGFKNLNGVAEGNVEIRGLLSKFSGSQLYHISSASGMHPQSLSKFLTRNYYMKQATQRRVRDAIAELGLEGGVL